MLFGYKQRLAETEATYTKLVLGTLKVSLESILSLDISPLLQLVHVYGVCSFVQDQIRSGSISVSDDVKGLINALGRERYGQNRTEPEESVTAKNVFLGNYCGLNTFPVEEWLDGTRSSDVLPTIENQARGMLGNACELIKLLP